jgi:hypothetical protein
MELAYFKVGSRTSEGGNWVSNGNEIFTSIFRYISSNETITLLDLALSIVVIYGPRSSIPYPLQDVLFPLIYWLCQD